MKISIVSTVYGSDSGGAIGIIAENQALRLSKNGNEVSIFTVGKKDEITEEKGLKIFTAETKPIPWFYRSYLCIRNFKIEKKFNKFLLNNKPDLVHFHGLYHEIPYSTIKIAKNMGIKTVVTIHDVMAISPQKLSHFIKKDTLKVDPGSYKISLLELLRQNGKSFNPLRNMFIRKYLKYADKILTVSLALKDVMAANNIKNTTLLHNGIDIENWKNIEENELNEFKSKYNLNNKKVLFIAGRLSVAKGVNQTLEMLKLVLEKNPDVILFIACQKDAYAQKIIEVAEKKGVEDKIIFSGWLNRNEMRKAYAASDIVLVPSIIFDSFPTMNLEAMASKKPVIGTCFGGTQEIIKDGINGYIINPYMINDFKDRVLELLNNDELRIRMGNDGYDIVSKNFNQNIYMEKLIKLYDL